MGVVRAGTIISVMLGGMWMFGSGCAATEVREETVAASVEGLSDVELLGVRLSGSFASTAQAARDPDNYRDIRLHAVRIWGERGDGVWLYVEQATAEAPGRPYRQRIYHLSSVGGDELVSEIYTLPGDAARFAGAYDDPGTFGVIGPEDLTRREGCTMYLRRRGVDGAFVGGTRGDGCESTLRGAAYTTSEATIFADRMLTWDRGYDEGGRQVWGALAGPYVFVRVDAVETD